MLQNIYEMCPRHFVSQQFVPFYCWIAFCGMAVPQFIHLSPGWKTLELFPVCGDDESRTWLLLLLTQVAHSSPTTFHFTGVGNWDIWRQLCPFFPIAPPTITFPDFCSLIWPSVVHHPSWFPLHMPILYKFLLEWGARSWTYYFWHMVGWISTEVWLKN